MATSKPRHYSSLPLRRGSGDTIRNSVDTNRTFSSVGRLMGGSAILGVQLV